MQLRRNEIRTGLLVLITLVVLVGVLLALGAPGLFQPMKTFYIFFDNASGIQSGSPVLLAGRKIGQVTNLESPVSVERRPKEGKYEVLMEVKVHDDAVIYKNVHVYMRQLGLLGEQVIDFAQGDETSGLAEENTIFLGERVPGVGEVASKAIEALEPLAQQGTLALAELERTAKNTTRLTAPGSDLDRAIVTYRKVGGNLQHITDQILKDDRFDESMENVRSITVNARQFTDTIKRQPWRLIWPSTKKYPEDELRKGNESQGAQIAQGTEKQRDRSLARNRAGTPKTNSFICNCKNCKNHSSLQEDTK